MISRNRFGKVLGGLVAVLLILGIIVVGCAPAPVEEVEKVYVANLSHPFARETVYGWPNEILKQHIEKATEGRLEVKIWPAGTMHTNFEDGLHACLAGTNQLAYINTQTLEMLDHSWTCYQVPGVVQGFEHWKKIIETPSYKELNESMAEKHGVKVLLWSTDVAHSAVVWNTKRPVVTPDDWKGLKLSCSPSELQVTMIEAFGANATPLSFPEAAAGISQGVIDGGLLGPAAACTTWAAAEELPYATMPPGGSDLTANIIGWVVNCDWWNSLPADIREAAEAELPAITEENHEFQWTEVEKYWDEYCASPKTHPTVLTEEQWDVWMEVMKSKVWPEVRGKVAAWDEMIADCEACVP